MDITSIIDYLGYLGTIPISLGIGYVFLSWKRFFQYFKVFMMSYGLCHFIKTYIPRARPYIDNIDRLRGPPLDPIYDYTSFPSGHTTMISVLCITLFVYYYKKTNHNKFCFLIFIPIFLVAFSRCYMGYHYISDCIAGFCVALFCYMYSLMLDANWIL